MSTDPPDESGTVAHLAGMTLADLERALKHARECGAIDKSPVLFEHLVSLDSYEDEDLENLIATPIEDGSLLQAQIVRIHTETRCADEPAVFVDIGYLVVS